MDFVIPWVNGKDPAWLKEFEEINHKQGNDQPARFRDWDNLQYLFRGIEQFTPWVNTVHFITWGHLPQWLNQNHPKLNIVPHREFIPQVYLPTFNAATIELNVHHIDSLNEEYVYFNDDTFLLHKVPETIFFKNGKIRDKAIFDTLTAGNQFEKILFTNLSVISRHFLKYRAIKEAPAKWFNLRYGKSLLKNLWLTLAKRGHTGFENPHLPQPHRKSTLKRLWEEEPEILDKTCRQTFRQYYSVNQYLQRYWDLASNNFYPGRSRGLFFRLDNRGILAKATAYIKHQRKPAVCINDSDFISEAEFAYMKEEIKAAFSYILPGKSGYEL